MKYYHYSNKPLKEFDTTLVLSQITQRYKPYGLWFSCDIAWKDWCESEDYELERLKYCSELILDFKKLAVIDTLKRFDLFEIAFGKGGILGTETKDISIDWEMVAKKYYGIVINPYFYERRLKSFWYHGWDVAGGCIWNKKAILEIK